MKQGNEAKGSNKITYVIQKLDAFVVWLDHLPLLWVGGILLLIVLLPNLALKEGSVFIIHDQLDESMMNYVLTARHWGQEQIPEMLGGINASGIEPAAFLFALFYLVMQPFCAFLLTYGIVVLCGFIGMYLAVKELADSSILAVCCGGCFCLLPLYPVYGLSQMGIPLVFYAFLCLYRGKRRVLAWGMILFFGLTSHLVYTGYVVLGFALLAILLMWGKKDIRNRLLLGFTELLAIYLAVNYRLVSEILLGKAGYVSHREEMVNGAFPFVQTVWDVFCNSAQHAFAYQTKLILPIFILLVLGAVFYRRWNPASKKLFRLAAAGFALLFLIAVFYGICKSDPVVQWKNSVSGFLHYFQIERVYWLYSAGWYLEFALTVGIYWREAYKQGHFAAAPLLTAAFMVFILYPTADTILKNSYFYMNVNQYNNGSDITGYISWESYYAEDLMEELERAIGRDMADYRVGHLGISPAPALMHGFYTIDGYSDNYPLEYKHAFRKVIAAELEKAPDTAGYFDNWGSRCYLFNSQSGNYWLLKKGNEIRFEGLEFDMPALRELGCNYLFSGAEIADAERMGLKPMGYYETETSYWGIWLYEIL